MRQFLISAGIKLLVATILLCGAYYVVNHSNFYYLFIGNVLFLLGLAFLFEAIFSLLFGLIKKLRERKTAIISTSRATFIVLFIADFIIRMTGIMQTYPERADARYFSIAQQEKLDSWYWIHTPNTTLSNQKKEFLFSRNVNSIGISEKEISVEKGEKYRILAIGDSFTEGVGTSYENSWVKQMETRWKSHKVETINAGIGGSDPVYEFVLYRDKLVKYKPDLIVLTVNLTDIYDITERGGFERFHTDGTAGKEPPSWEWIYASNHFFRMIIHSVFRYNSNLVRNADSKEVKVKSVEILKDVFTRFKELSVSQKSEFLVVIQPTLVDFTNGKHTPFFGQNELLKFLKSENIHHLDASIEFKRKETSIVDYYYPLDTHFNEKGYAFFGELVYKEIEKIIQFSDRSEN